MKLVIFFAGTGNDETAFLKSYNYGPDDGRVCTLCIKGCHAPEVCNSYLFPNLKEFARRFTSAIFQNGQLESDINTLKSVGVNSINGIFLEPDIELMPENRKMFKKNILYITLDPQREDEFTYTIITPQGKKRIDRIAVKDIKNFNPTFPLTIKQLKAIKKQILEITATRYHTIKIAGKLDSALGVKDLSIASTLLTGYSRGGVTCYEVLKQLNSQESDLPVDTIASEPVPGNLYLSPGTNAWSVSDCSQVKNLNSDTTILGAYTGELNHLPRDEEGDLKPDENNYLTETASSPSIFHRLALSQIVVKVPPSTKRNLIVIPNESHWQSRLNAPNNNARLSLCIANKFWEEGLISYDKVKEKEEI